MSDIFREKLAKGFLATVVARKETPENADFPYELTVRPHPQWKRENLTGVRARQEIISSLQNHTVLIRLVDDHWQAVKVVDRVPAYCPGCGGSHAAAYSSNNRNSLTYQPPKENNLIFHPRGLEIDVVYGCNLRCPQCSHLAPVNRGYLPVEEFIAWCEPWAKRIRPYGLCIIGGEPTLHPQLPSILNEAKRIWKHGTRIELWTNGTLPQRLTPEVIAALKDVYTTISVKPYREILGQDYTEPVNESIAIYKQHGLNIRIRNLNMIRWHQEDFIPWDNPPEQAFAHCNNAKCVQHIYKGKLYRCLKLAMFQKLHDIGKVQWEGFHYTPLDPATATDLAVKKLIDHKTACPQCRFCPTEYPVMAPPSKEYPQGYTS
jgi:organic radical activating enzyme